MIGKKFRNLKTGYTYTVLMVTTPGDAKGRGGVLIGKHTEIENKNVTAYEGDVHDADIPDTLVFYKDEEETWARPKQLFDVKFVEADEEAQPKTPEQLRAERFGQPGEANGAKAPERSEDAGTQPEG